MSLPRADFPTSGGTEHFPSLNSDVDPVRDNVFDVMPLDRTYDAILDGETQVNLALVNYCDPRWESDIHRIIMVERQRRRPWSQLFEVEIDEFEHIPKGPDYGIGPRPSSNIVFTGRTALNGCETPIFGRVEKTRYGWAAVPGLPLDRPDVPALKVLAGEIPLPGEARERWQRTPKDKYAHLRGPADRLLANLREGHRIAGQPYVTPSGRRSY